MIDKINLNGTVYTLAGSGGSTPTTSGLKVLCIGNSFCENMMMYLSGLATNMQVSGISAYNLFTGGQTIAGWWTAYKNDTTGTCEKWCGEIDGLTHSTAKTVHEMLVATDWDVVILQQFHSTNTPPSYETLLPSLVHMIAHIRKDCTNKKVKIGMQTEWPRSIGSTRNGPKGILGYLDIMDEAKDIVDGGHLDFIIPTSTAVMNAAYDSTLNTLMPSGSSYDSDKVAEEGGTTHDENKLLLKQVLLNSEPDKLHLSEGVGRYITCATLWETVIRPWCGKSISASTYTKAADSNDTGSIALTNDNRGMCHAAVLYALSNPWQRSELDFKDLT